MFEKLPHSTDDTDTSTGRPSPLDVVKAIQRRREHAEEPAHDKTNEEVDQESQDDSDIIEVNGERYRRISEMRHTKKFNGERFEDTEVPYTFKEWYSHSYVDSNTGLQHQGPGWDSRFRLSDDELAMQLHGRTFSVPEFSDPAHNMPETPYYHLQRIGDSQEDSEN